MRPHQRQSAPRGRAPSPAVPHELRRPARARRERRGRGLRGALAPTGVPLHRSRSERFDELVLDAVAELEEHWAPEMTAIEFAVDDVPSAHDEQAAGQELSHELIADHGVLLGRVVRDAPDATGGAGSVLGSVLIVVYRRPIESRAVDPEQRADLVFSVVAELVADVLGRDLDEIDPPGW